MTCADWVCDIVSITKSLVRVKVDAESCAAPIAALKAYVGSTTVFLSEKLTARRFGKCDFSEAEDHEADGDAYTDKGEAEKAKQEYSLAAECYKGNDMIICEANARIKAGADLVETYAYVAKRKGEEGSANIAAIIYAKLGDVCACAGGIVKANYYYALSAREFEKGGLFEQEAGMLIKMGADPAKVAEAFDHAEEASAELGLPVKADEMNKKAAQARETLVSK